MKYAFNDTFRIGTFIVIWCNCVTIKSLYINMPLKKKYKYIYYELLNVDGN